MPYTFKVGQTEVTVSQQVAFLNTVDPFGANRHHLWGAAESSTVWPLYGSVNRTKRAKPGHRYSVAASVWANKPYKMTDFLSDVDRAALGDRSLDRELEADRGKAVVDRDVGAPTIAYALDEVTDLAREAVQVPRIERVEGQLVAGLPDLRRVRSVDPSCDTPPTVDKDDTAVPCQDHPFIQSFETVQLQRADRSTLEADEARPRLLLRWLATIDERSHITPGRPDNR